jgi:2-iminoacetate synthase ThiH
VRGRIGELANLTSPLRPLEESLKAAQHGLGLGVEDVASLLVWGREPDRHPEIHAAATAHREGTSGRTVELIIPEYLSSFCQNDCLYCGYRKSNALAERVRLSLNEYERELDLILAWGHRQIELVLADDPEFSVERLAPYVELTRRKLAELGGGLVALNAPAYKEDAYRRLHAVGLDWLALWQETYDETQFARWHLQGSPKREYGFRLDVWDRAISAGFTRVALGVLFGLFDWRFEVLALVEHASYLVKTYGIVPHAIGIPRLKPARGVLASQKPSRYCVSDDDYRLALSIYRLAFPRTRLFFNTREPYEFNMSMVGRGDLFTVDCETLPGAYLHGRLPGQFFTHPYPQRRTVKAAFAERGYACRFLEPENLQRIEKLEVKTGQAGLLESLQRSSSDHHEVRLRLDEWEVFLERMRSTPVHLRRIAARDLRERLQFFETGYFQHCRHEEIALQGLQAMVPVESARLAQVLSDHERFAVDLDRFLRQIASYEQSGDPTVLLTLGGRMIGELRGHLEFEDSLFAGCLGPPRLGP